MATLIAFFYLSVGTLAAAEAAVPGEALYGLKRLSEDAQLAVAPQTEVVELNAQFAERRLEEIEVLEKKGIILPAIIEDMADSTEAALNNTLSRPERPEVYMALADLTRRQQQVLSTLQPEAPDPATEAAFEHALLVSTTGHQQAVAAIHEIQTQTGVAVAAVTASPATVEVTKIPLVPPTNTAAAPPSPVPSFTPIPSPSSTQESPTPTNTSTDVRSSPTASPSATPSASPRSTEITSPTVTISPSPTVMPSPTASRTPGPTKTPTDTPTATPSPTATATDTPTVTPSPTWTPSPTATDTPTLTPSPTQTDTPSPTPTWTPSPTNTATPTDTPTPTLTPSMTPTVTGTPGPSSTFVFGASTGTPTSTPALPEGQPE